MSESVIEVDATLEVSEVSEIKDSSVETESPSLLESANNKRRLDDDENDLEEFDNDDETRSTRKKMCIEDDTEIETEKDISEEIIEPPSSVIEEPSTKSEETIETSEVETIDETQEISGEMSHEPEIEKSIQFEVIEEAEDETNLLTETTTFNQSGFEIEDEEDPEEEIYEEESVRENTMMDEEQEDEEEEEMDEDDFDESESDDEQMMSNVLQNSGVTKVPQHFLTSNDEPIELDDSDDDDLPPQPTSFKSIKTEVEEEEEEFEVENNVLVESEPEDDLTELQKKLSSREKKYGIVLSGKIVKKAMKSLRQIKVTRTHDDEDDESAVENQHNQQESNENNKETETAEKVETKVDEQEKVENGQVEAMETEDISESVKKVDESNTEIPKPENVTTTKDTAQIKSVTETNEKSAEKPDDRNSLQEACDDDKSAPKTVEQTAETISLLEEINKSSIDEIFNRFVLMKSSERSPSLDEFSEELFNCLQVNKVEIQKATDVWNEKLSSKFKIRQLMEKVRRHRAVMEIETFGCKPETSGNNVHPNMISSKSSTTTNSEGENYDKGLRISNESVSRLIQGARASIMRQNERQRIEESALLNENAYDSTWNIQNNSIQGRQGQIVDVQSIINDFRQKNPQEIPRRGRRVKSVNSSGLFESHLSNHDEGHSLKEEFSSLSQDFSNGKTNRSSNSFPEVSLHPVHQNMYKNHQDFVGGTPKSSLLQSILTKSTKSSPIGFQNSLPSTSTLARLLTAPERSLHSTPKQNFSPTNNRQSSSKVHNGEITITPINHSRKNYSMDEDENSMEPPLVIDENFDGRSFEDKKSAELLCQGCKKNKAFFMCAGCSRQWYCSKECQEMAWDSHSSYCSV